VEVLNDTTLLWRLESEEQPQGEADEDSRMLELFLDFLSRQAITADPYVSSFALTGPLRRYGRLKDLGLPDHYRLFFRPFEAEGQRLLLILWLGFPRKDGDRNAD